MRKALDDLLGRFDAVVTPTRASVAPPIGYDFDKPPQPSPSPSPSADRPSPPATIPAGNLAGLPALCVPNGFGKAGCPPRCSSWDARSPRRRWSISATEYQNASGWHLKRPPPLDKLAERTALAPARTADWSEPGRPDLYRL